MAVLATAIHSEVTEAMSIETVDVQSVSYNPQASHELIDSAQLAARLQVPESWVRNHTRERTPKDERIPCVRFGRYVRFEWGSPRLEQWVARKRQ